MYAQNQRLVRVTNQQLILDALRVQPLARVDLARQLRMSGPSISKHVERLMEMNLIAETGMISAGLGRRRVQLTFNPQCGFSCAVELCAHTARLALADLDGSILEEAELEPYVNLDSLVLARVVKRIGQLLGNHTAHPERLLGVCLMNGHVTRSLPESPGEMLSALMELKKSIESKYHIPVFIEHSTRMAAAGESLDRTSPTGALLYAYVGDTVSAGVAVKTAGKLLDWNVFFFGDLNDIIPDSASAVAEWRGNNLSKRNTLGEQATLPAVLRAVTEKFVPGEGYLGEQLEAADDITPETICTGAEKGDSACLFAIQNAAVRLAVSIANLACLLDFDEVVIGGSADRLGDAYRKSTSTFLNEWLNRMVPLTVRWPTLGGAAMMKGGVRRAADGAIAALLQEPRTVS